MKFLKKMALHLRATPWLKLLVGGVELVELQTS
jgi:hypothetical protein